MLHSHKTREIDIYVYVKQSVAYWHVSLRWTQVQAAITYNDWMVMFLITWHLNWLDLFYNFSVSISIIVQRQLNFPTAITKLVGLLIYQTETQIT